PTGVDLTILLRGSGQVAVMDAAGQETRISGLAEATVPTTFHELRAAIDGASPSAADDTFDLVAGTVPGAGVRLHRSDVSLKPPSPSDGERVYQETRIPPSLPPPFPANRVEPSAPSARSQPDLADQDRSPSVRAGGTDIPLVTGIHCKNGHFNRPDA